MEKNIKSKVLNLATALSLAYLAPNAQAGYLEQIGNPAIDCQDRVVEKKSSPKITIKKRKKSIEDVIKLTTYNNGKKEVEVFSLPEIDYHRKGDFYQRGKEDILKLVTNGNLYFNGREYHVTDSSIDPENSFKNAFLSYKNGKKDEIEIRFASLPKKQDLDSFKYLAPPKEKVFNFSEQEVEEKKSSTQEVLKQSDFKTKSKTKNTSLDEKVNGAWVFDVDGDGNYDYMQLVRSSDGRYLIKDLNGKEIRYYSVEKVRARVLENSRFLDGDLLNPAYAYAMTYGPQGEDVVKFMYETNKLSKDKYCVSKDECYDVKFKTLEGFIGFIDKVANTHVRADYIGSKILDAYKKGQLKVKSPELDKRLKAYSGTFGEEVSGGKIALMWGLGSAIYNVITSDGVPYIQANSALVTARGAQNAENLKLFKSQGVNLNSVVGAYNSSVNMYDAQIKASENRVRRIEF